LILRQQECLLVGFATMRKWIMNLFELLRRVAALDLGTSSSEHRMPLMRRPTRTVCSWPTRLRLLFKEFAAQNGFCNAGDKTSYPAKKLVRLLMVPMNWKNL
jgi:hypothetical protein